MDLGGVSESSRGVGSGRDSSVGIQSLCLVFASLSYIPAVTHLTAVPEGHQVPLGIVILVRVQEETAPVP